MATSVDESVLADLACERVGRNDAAAAAADEGARASAMDRLVMSQHDLQCLAAWQNVARCCALCSTLFHEIANLGVWTCAQHAGPFELDMWTCCWKRGMRARGCVRSHHKATPGPYDARTQWLKISHSMLKHVAKRMHARTLYECVAQEQSHRYADSRHRERYISARAHAVDCAVYHTSSNNSHKRLHISFSRFQVFSTWR